MTVLPGSVAANSHCFNNPRKGGSDLEGGTGYPRFSWCGDACLVAEFGDKIDPLINSMVRDLDLRIRGLKLPWLVETVPTYRSLAVYVDPWDSPREEVELAVTSLAREVKAKTMPSVAVVEIPVCYGGDFGPDLERVSMYTALGPDDIIRLHSSKLYRVYMMGFTPGFPTWVAWTRDLKRPDSRTREHLFRREVSGSRGSRRGSTLSPAPAGGTSSAGRRWFSLIRREPVLSCLRRGWR